MRLSNTLIGSHSLARALKACPARAAALTLLAVGIAGLPASALAGGHHEHGEGRDLEELRSLVHKAQVAELLDLAADFHGALSYNGDPAIKGAHLTVMSNLWATCGTLTFSNTVTSAVSSFTGKDAVIGFFATGGYFLNNWVSLAPEYKTRVSVQGDTAHISTQCVGIDLTASPMVVKNVIQVEADAVRVEDTWRFVAMHNSSPAPL